VRAGKTDKALATVSTWGLSKHQDHLQITHWLNLALAAVTLAPLGVIDQHLKTQASPLGGCQKFCGILAGWGKMVLLGVDALKKMHLSGQAAAVVCGFCRARQRNRPTTASAAPVRAAALGSGTAAVASTKFTLIVWLPYRLIT
jgi:hypothetical protein